MTGSYATFFQNMLAFLQASLPLVAAVSWVTGVGLVAYVGYRMAFSRAPGGQGYGAGGPISVGTVAALLLLAGVFMELPAMVRSTAQTVLGSTTDYRQALALVPQYSGGNAFWTLVLEVIVMWIVLIGAVASYRGVLLWMEMANGGGGSGKGDLFWRGLWHIVFGALAVNIGRFMG